jgi:hypothetical protein
LPPNHRYGKNRKDFFVGRVENDVASSPLSSEELHDVVSEYDDIVFGLQSGKQKFLCFGLTHIWIKRSIVWALKEKLSATTSILSMDMCFILNNTGIEERHTTTVFMLRDRLVVS